MKFYIQNGKHKKIVNHKNKDKAIAIFLKELIAKGESTREGELLLKPLTYVSQAGFLKDILEYGDQEMIHNAIEMAVTGSCIRNVDGLSDELREQCANALENVLILEKKFKGARAVIQEFMNDLKS